MRHIGRHVTAVIGLTLLALASLAGAAEAWGLDALMRSLAQTRTGHAHFVEEKSIALLDAPVVATGELVYRAPDHLERRTLTPQPESMVVDADTLVIERDGRSFHLQLHDYPELAAFIESIRGTLAGDRARLEKAYRLSLEGAADNWTLQLLPIDERMQAVVWRIRISGAHATVRRIEITQADGDRSVMRITEIPAQ